MTRISAHLHDLTLDQERVIFTLAMYAGPGGIPLRDLREWSDVRGRPLANALNGLRNRGLAWCGASGHWYPTEAGIERGRA